jgi:drug/metabolite transporter (DMT)-like permease
MEAWIPITVAAALFQTVRTALQKHLKARLSTTGATFARFLYASPLALLYVAGLAALAELPVPDPNPAFVFHTALGGLAQIGGTAALVHLFSYRNFAVGTAYSKTETVQTALVGVVVLGEAPTASAAVAILVSLVGVLTISTARQRLRLLTLFAHLFDKPALIGIASGAGFGIAAVSYRAAALSLGGEGYVMQAAFTLAGVLVFQTAAMALYMRLREPGEIGAVLSSWRVSAWVGVSGVVASAGWFTAMTLQNAAYVRALGQIELVFTFLASALLFRERTTRLELAGIALIVAGILVLVLA